MGRRTKKRKIQIDTNEAERSGLNLANGNCETIPMVKETTYEWRIISETGMSDTFTLLHDPSQTNVRLSLEEMSDYHECSECKNALFTNDIDFVADEYFLSLYLLIGSSQNHGCSFLQKYKKFKLKIFVTTTDDKLLLYKRKICIVTEETKKYGFCYFIPYYGFRSWFEQQSQQTLIMLCKIELIDQDFPEVTDIQIQQEVCSTKCFNSLLSNKTLSDVIFKLKGGKTVSAHKVILFVKSPYFRRMFAHHDGVIDTINIDFDYDPFWETLKYIYTAEIENLETLGMDILKIAYYYQIDDLKLICENFLKTNLKQTDNVIQILKLANECKAVDLKNYCISYFIENFETLEDKDNSLMSLIKECPILAHELITQQNAFLKNKTMLKSV